MPDDNSMYSNVNHRQSGILFYKLTYFLELLSWDESRV